MGQLARAYMLTQRNDEAVAAADRALAAIGGRRLPQLTADILATRGTALVARPDEAEAILRGAVALAERAGHLPTLMRARNNLMSVQAGELPLAQAAQYLSESADVARRGGEAHFLAQMLLQLVDLATEMGTLSAASAPLEELAGMELDSFRQLWFVSSSGLQAAFRGDLVAAERSLVAMGEGGGNVDTFWAENVASSTAMLHMGMGDLAGAAEIAMRVALVASLDYYPFLVAANTAGTVDPARAAELVAAIDAVRPQTRALAVTRLQVDALSAVADARWDDARAAYRLALRGFDALDMHLWKALSGLQFEAYLGARFDEAREAGGDAEALFAANDAAGFVDRYRAAFTGTPAPPMEGAPPGAAPRAAVPVDAEQPA